MGAPLHEDRVTAEGFGAVADAYDDARPGYADAMVGKVAGSHRSVLDVGCGTGKLGAQLAAAGCEVLGIEPDERMAAVARRRGIEVEVATFETWDSGGRCFDAVVSGQAWHWVDPVAGAARVAEVLLPGGVFVGMWNVYHHDPDLLALMVPIYEDLVPGMRSYALGVVPPPEADDPAGAAFAAGPFDGAAPGVRTCASRLVPWARDGWIALLATFSDHRLIPEGTRAELFRRLGHELPAVLPVTVTTDAIVATRR